MSNTDQVSILCTDCGAPISFPLGATQVVCSFCDGGVALAAEARPVRLACPVCAGNFYYMDGWMAGKCPFCQTGLLGLTRHRLLRFTIRPHSPCPAEGAQLTLVPFWRIHGLMYGWDYGSKVTLEADMGAQPADVQGGDSYVPVTRVDSGPKKLFRGRVVERWLPDPSALALGISSLRLRAAVFPLEVFTAEHESLGRKLPATLSLEQVQQQLHEQAFDLGAASDGLSRLDLQRRELVAASTSLLYYPFWVQPVPEGYQIWDGVTGKQEPLIAPSEAPSDHATTAFNELVLVELRCKNCQAELAPGNHSVVIPCHACDTFWVAEGDDLKPFAAAYAEPVVSVGQGPRVWLPFWQVQCEVDYCQRQALTVADLANVLGVLRPPGNLARAAADSPLCYYVPAYGAFRAPRLDVAARDLTRQQPELVAGQYEKGQAFAAFFAPEDAAQLGYVVLLQLIKGTPRRLQSLRIRTQQVKLWYVPFVERGRELVSALNGARYERTTFRGLAH